MISRGLWWFAVFQWTADPVLTAVELTAFMGVLT